MILVVGIVEHGVGVAHDVAHGAVGAGADAVRSVVVGAGVAALVVDVASAPSLDLDALKVHDRRVRAVHEAAPALLPVRYVEVHDDDAALVAALRPRLPALAASLQRVRGKEQMTLRVAGAAAAPSDVVVDAARPGTAFLARKQAQQRAAAVPALDPLRAALSSIVVEERVEAAAPPLLASVFHLIPRGRADAYLDVVRAHVDTVAVRVKVSGPFPCWAFT